jgi:hypothetical protein
MGIFNIRTHTHKYLYVNLALPSHRIYIAYGLCQTQILVKEFLYILELQHHSSK